MKKILLSFILGVLMTGAAYASGETLSNGVRFKSIHRDYTQTISVVMVMKGGVFRENPDTLGTGALFARTWLKSGTFLEKVEYLGGRTGAGISNDYLEFSLSLPSDSLDTVLAELRKQILTPSFSGSVFEREKELTLREIEAEKDDPNSLAFQLFMQATYKNHPYALRNEGTAESVSRLKLSHIESYYKSHFYGSDMIVALAGNFTPKQENAVKKIFSALPKGTPIKIDCANSAIKAPETVTATDSRIQEAKLFVSYTAPAADNPDYVYTKVLSDLLGGGMSSPYFTALRKEKGYAYSVGTMYPSMICSSRFTGYIGLQPENIDDAIQTMRRLNSAITSAFTEEDLEKSKNHIIGQVLSEAETNARTAWYAAVFESLGLGFDYISVYIDRLRKVKKEDMEKVSDIFKQAETVFIYKPSPKKGATLD